MVNSIQVKEGEDSDKLLDTALGRPLVTTGQKGLGDAGGRSHLSGALSYLSQITNLIVNLMQSPTHPF